MISDKLQSLAENAADILDIANAVTEAGDTNIYDAVGSLIQGYKPVIYIPRIGISSQYRFINYAASSSYSVDSSNSNDSLIINRKVGISSVQESEVHVAEYDLIEPGFFVLESIGDTGIINGFTSDTRIPLDPTKYSAVISPIPFYFRNVKVGDKRGFYSNQRYLYVRSSTTIEGYKIYKL